MVWQSRPVFVSSTFADMQAERDHLFTHVFPALEEHLKARRRHLEWVDLRLGVATAQLADAEARERQVLKVCLAEVKRCRPFLIVLLGDRYGWVPPAERMAAAVAEEGFAVDVVGRSVTDLEVRFGVLTNQEGPPRCFFYFREPLPYRDMPSSTAALYADAYDKAPGAVGRAKRLVELKEDIKKALPNRVRTYLASWDRRNHRVTALDDWGRMVLADLVAELDAATAVQGTEESVSWQQSERIALEDYIEDRARDFVGRDAILTRLETLAMSAKRERAPWGLVLAGAAGAGKSATFGELHRRLQRSGTLVLGHAAGASARSTSVEDMLRRWIEELIAALGADPGFAKTGDPENIETAFRDLLALVAAERRVVVLIDGLDQFEATTRARFVTWLPRVWPANARLIATAIPGDASQALAEREGVELLQLPLLDVSEARRIAEGICARYHRTLEPEVVDALIAKQGVDGPAWGNTLWLVLAVEELNLVDADDFARANRAYKGNAAAQLRALMVDIVTALPSDAIGLYRATFDRAGELFGHELTRAFVGVVAVGRGGWRESDFRVMLPRITRSLAASRSGLLARLFRLQRVEVHAHNKRWDELRFASLRRLFRGQIRQRGTLGQWSVNHTQMRTAALEWCAANGASAATLHEAVAKHLLELPSDDPLRASETMVHLIGSDDWPRARAFYGSSSLTPSELDGATRTIAEYILVGEQHRLVTRVDTILGLLKPQPAEEMDTSVLGNISRRFLFDLDDKLTGVAEISIREKLAEHVRQACNRLRQASPGDQQSSRDLSMAHSRLGALAALRGALGDAHDHYLRGLAISEELLHEMDDNPTIWRDMALGHSQLASILVQQGQLLEAQAEYETSSKYTLRQINSPYATAQAFMDLLQSFEGRGNICGLLGNLSAASTAYQAAVDTARDLLGSKTLLPSAADRPRWLRALATSTVRLGDCQKSQGEFDAALKSYTDSLAAREELAFANPSDRNAQFDVTIGYERVGDLQLAQGELDLAVDSYSKAAGKLESLVKKDRGNAVWQRTLGLAWEKQADAAEACGDLDTSLDLLLKAKKAFVALVETAPGNLDYIHDIAMLDLKLGNAWTAMADIGQSLAAYTSARSSLEELRKRNPANSDWRRNLGIVLEKMGDAQRAQSQLDDAMHTYQQSLSLRQSLLELDPNNADWQRDVAVTQGKVSETLQLLENYEEAEPLLRKADAIFEQLSSRNPDDNSAIADLARSKGGLGQLLIARGKRTDALEAFKAGRELMDQLASKAPYVVAWRRLVDQFDRDIERVKAMDDRNRSRPMSPQGSSRLTQDSGEWKAQLPMLYRTGDMLMRRGSVDAAVTAYEDSLAAALKIVDAHPGDVECELCLALLYEKLADAQRTKGALDSALENYRSSLDIFDWLATDDPENWLRSVAIGHDRVGALLHEKGDLSDAVESFSSALEVMEQLVRNAPETPSLQFEVAASHGKIGRVLSAMGQHAAALKMFSDGREMIAAMAARSPNDAQLKECLEAFDQDIASLGR